MSNMAYCRFHIFKRNKQKRLFIFARRKLKQILK